MDDFKIYDNVDASCLEEHDQIVYDDQYIVLDKVIDNGDTIYVKGVSYITDEVEEFDIPADEDVKLWMLA